MSLQITSSKFFAVKNDFIAANGEVIFNDKLIIKLSIGKSKDNGYIVLYKSDVVDGPDGRKYYPSVKFTNADAQTEINNAIIDEFMKSDAANNRPNTSAGARNSTSQQVHNTVASHAIDDEDIPF